MLTPQIDCDLELLPSELTPDILPSLFLWLERLAPFGMDNPEPIFLTRGLTISGPIRTIKDRHACIPLQSPRHASLSAMGWSRTGAQSWPDPSRRPQPNHRFLQVDLVYRLKQNKHPRFPGIELGLDRPIASSQPDPDPAVYPASSMQHKAASFEAGSRLIY